MRPKTWYPWAWRNSARNWPSWPVIPVMRARGIVQVLGVEAPNVSPPLAAARSPSARKSESVDPVRLSRPMSPLPILTVASRRQLPHLRAFASSVVETGNDASVTAVLVDDPLPAVVLEPPLLLRLEAVHPSVGHLHELRVLCPTGSALACSVTPSVALRTLEQRKS